jgi:hypothetical protein
MFTLRKLIDFYVAEHNATMPHSAFRGQTPDEMHFGQGATIPDELALKRREAQELASNGTETLPAPSVHVV